ncbi:MAG: hypothetical protein LQ338_002389 [Usnochroma carphineum]|nr:MAG: hypothetical protein LQ338_002389 [Usnochroma carphineum]
MASISDDEMEYLSPSFDPATLTVPRLRSILLSHDITYPASAKKPQLIDLFNQELKPRSRKILAARSRIRRTSKGITDMPSSREGTVNGDDGGRSGSMLPPPIPDTSRRQPRKSSRQSSEDFIGEEQTAKASRKSSSKHPRPSDTETSEVEIKRPSARKTRRSEVAPTVKVEEPEGRPIRPSLEKSPFSDENPFQSGSSPLTPSEARRKSAGANADRRKSTSNRRRTDGVSSGAKSQPPQQDGVIVPSSRTFEMPLARIKKEIGQNEVDSEVEAGEEFAPEEQLELSRDRAANGGLDVLPTRKTKGSRKSGGTSVLRSAPWAVFTALLSGYALWFRREKLEVGYCGLGKTSDSIAGVQIPEWASLLQPECEPCPQHAYCYENLETRCEPDFVLRPHPLSLGGLVPLPPTCEPDGEKARRVKAVADKAVEELRERNAKSECGTLTDEQGKIVRTPEIDEQDLKKHVAKQRRKDMSNQEFEDLWKGAIGDMLGLDEVVQATDGHRTYLASTSLARIPFSCSVRRSLRLALARYRIPIAFLAAIVYAVFYARNRIITLRNDTARVPMLVSTTLDRLATQAALYNRGDAPESWISVGQLRDDVLRDEFSAKRREAMWKRVRKVVEMNANVRASERELRAGDVSRVWEWIGNLGIVDDAWAEGGRRSGVRFSLGDQRRDSSTPDRGAGRALMAGTGSNEMMEKRHWDEGRPIY